MTEHEFGKLVSEGCARLPEKFRAKIKNVAFLIEDEPSDEVRTEMGLAEGDTLLGFYRGIPATARGVDYGVGGALPDAIIIYQKPTEEMAEGDPERIREIVADTVWHEVGHYFGLDEAEIEAREKERGRGDGCA